MQSIQDFEKRIYEAKQTISYHLAGERATQPGTTLEAATRLCGQCQRAGAARQSREPVGRKERAWFNAGVKVSEETELRNWAQEEGLWMEEAAFTTQYADRYVDEGAEQKVYLKEDGRSVVKINTGHFHATWLDFFNRLTLHAALFPEIQYTVTGFTEEGEGLSVMVEQPWVEATRGATKEEVEAYLLQLGFTHTKYNDYYNRQQGILLEDLHDENVFIGLQDNLLFIDPVIYLETPDLGLGGSALFRFPFGGPFDSL